MCTMWTRRRLALGASLVLVAGSAVLWRACRQPAEPPHHTSVVRALNESERAELTELWGPLLPRPERAPWYLWWEAEDSSASNFPADNPFAPNTPEEAAILSGGRWVGTDGAAETPFLEYTLELPEAGDYQLYARKFWRHGPFRWRFGDAEWTTASSDLELLDGVPMRLHVGANWVHLGEVSLAPGPRRFRVELLEPKAPGAFDAFVLSRGEFIPRGKSKPEDPHPEPPEGWVTFAPAPDDFSEGLLDLRSLNHRRTGQAGFVRVSGSELVFEQTQKPARFWGVNAGGDLLHLSPERQQRYARRLAKLGVNLLRLHTGFWREDDVRQIDGEALERLHRLIPVLRDQGIYLVLSSYFPLWLPLKQEHGFGGYSGQHPFALAFFDPAFQQVQRDWFRVLLTSPNPHTGLPLARDPTLALFEIINEDSTLFWSFKPYESIPEPQTIELERSFGRWLGNKYGDLPSAFAAWASSTRRGDDVSQRRAGFLPLHTLLELRDRRAQDTAEFLARQMRDYYQGMHGFLKRDLGVQAVTICSNWITANPHLLGPLDDWANTACDVMDRHAYFQGPHEGDAASYAARAGQTYDDDSLLRMGAQTRSALPFIEPRVNGKPAVVSELGWPWPNRFRGEGPLLTAAYGRLHGLDGAMFFASSNPGWADALQKFEIADPATFGQFPAAALLFRQGLVREGAPVVEVSRTEQSLFALNGIPITTEPALDALRASDQPRVAKQLGLARGNDPLTFLVGPVALELGAPTDRFETRDVRSWIDVDEQRVRSNTDELSWQHATGLVEIRAPRVEAAFGFVGAASPIELPHLRFSPLLDYASLALVSLDAHPIAESRRLLLQIFSEATNSGWSAPGTGVRTIESAGGPPILTRAIAGTVEWLGEADLGWSVTALDANGYALRRTSNPTRRIPLLPGVFHYVLER